MNHEILKNVGVRRMNIEKKVKDRDGDQEKTQ